MKTSKLIERLELLVEKHGDVEFYFDEHSWTPENQNDLDSNVFYCEAEPLYDIPEGIYL